MFYTENGNRNMQILHNAKTDVLCIRLDEMKQDVINRHVSDDVVLDVGIQDKIVGIENLEASSHTNLRSILPIEYQVAAGVDS